jgi:hypothetical protein
MLTLFRYSENRTRILIEQSIVKFWIKDHRTRTRTQFAKPKLKVIRKKIGEFLEQNCSIRIATYKVLLKRVFLN